jgi:hypothetical protein
LVCQQALEGRDDVTVKQIFPLSKNDRHQFCKVVLEKAGKHLKQNQMCRVVYGEVRRAHFALLCGFYMWLASMHTTEPVRLSCAESVRSVHTHTRTQGYMIATKDRKKDQKKTGSAQSVYFVRDAGVPRVAGKYLEHKTDFSDGQRV